MALDIDAVWAGLFERLQGTLGFATYSRRRRDWPLEQLPALLLLDDAGDEVEIDADDRMLDGLPPAMRLTGEIVVLSRASDEDQVPTAKLNDLVRAVRAALEAPVGSGDVRYWTTLGGLAAAIGIPKVEKGEGNVSGQLAARMEIVIEVAPEGA